MDCSVQRFSADCPSRVFFDQTTDKWSIMVLAALDAGPHRFNAIKRRLEGVTQKALTQCLRRLERNGLVSRRVIPISPLAVEYELTTLGVSLLPTFVQLYSWIMDHLQDIEAARTAFDGRSAGALRFGGDG
ncbi:transcriptional regulator [Paraburkholderia dipogonis]|uniref:Transcriptional regulator n=1 Tax=Paraburkholderia dipogonis TaxID=1211383 RepID=A0A4Y8MX19_9BURK|nr:helix-turn-helix domain-containing protein [Paraburkholderia dipogonis]TFE41925.1 transcriptional regulator [Paraburkholderia dipogonis]